MAHTRGNVYPELEQLKDAMLSNSYERVCTLANAFLDASSGNKLVHFVVKTFADHYMTRNVALIEHVLKKLRALSRPVKTAKDRKELVALLMVLTREKASCLDFSKLGKSLQDLGDMQPDHHPEIDKLTDDEEQKIYLNMWLHCIAGGNSSAAVVVLRHLMSMLPSKSKAGIVWTCLALAVGQRGDQKDMFARYIQTCHALFNLRATQASVGERQNLIYTCCYLLAKRRQIVSIPVSGHEAATALTRLDRGGEEKHSSGGAWRSTSRQNKLGYLFFYPTLTMDHRPTPGVAYGEPCKPEIKEVKIRGAVGNDGKQSDAVCIQQQGKR